MKGSDQLSTSTFNVIVCLQAVWLQKLDPKTDGAARDWVAIYDDECVSFTFSFACVYILLQAVWLQKLDPKTDGAARDWVAIYDECSRILYQEIDYTLEGKNADKFAENFKWVLCVCVCVACCSSLAKCITSLSTPYLSLLHLSSALSCVF